MCRGSAQMIALICLKPTYPAVAPVFCINLHWDGEKNTTNTEWVRLVFVLNNKNINFKNNGYFWHSSNEIFGTRRRRVFFPRVNRNLTDWHGSILVVIGNFYIFNNSAISY
jgi:hypothetical protein